MNINWSVGQVLAIIRLDNRITRLRTAVERQAQKEGLTAAQTEELRLAAVKVIKEAQPVILRTLRARHNERKR